MGSDVKATPSVELTVVHLSGAAGVDNGDHRCFRSDGIDEDLPSDSSDEDRGDNALPAAVIDPSNTAPAAA